MANLKKSNVLIVDDIASQRDYLEAVLAPLSVNIVKASSGKEALREVLNIDFSVILMDIEMPGMKGYEVVKLIHEREKFKHIPIVMVTSNGEKSDALYQSYEAGAVDFVPKPVDATVLTHKISQFIVLDEHRRVAEDTTARLNVLLNTVSEGIIGVDVTGAMTFVNPKALELLSLDALSDGKRLQDFLVAERHERKGVSIDLRDNQTLYEFLSSGFRGMEGIDSDGLKGRGVWLPLSGKSFYSDYSYNVTRGSDGEIDGAVIIFKDGTQEKETEAKLIHLANFDYLTNVSNRAYFNDALKKAIARTQRTKKNLAIMFLDIDHFKLINDQYGHDIGDALLRNVSQKIEDSLRKDDLVSRMGGDEFAILLQDIPDKLNIANVAQKILDSVARPMEFDGVRLDVSISIGISFYDPCSMSMDDLLKSADIAMYEAKNEGRNNFQFFAKEMQERVKYDQRIEMLLAKAILNDELTVLYQPKISLSQKKMVGCEALIRWYPEDGGMISPDIFIPIAERTGQIIELGDWILDQVCQQISQWQMLPNFKGMVTAINVSVRQLGTSEFREKLIASMDRYSVSPDHVEIEVTETATTDDHNIFFSELEKIHDLGVKVSIDDFGTGHSSLDYLRKMPVDIIKIDRSFIKDIGMDEQDEELIRTILAISKTMSIQVIAEGTETVEQLAFLEENQVDNIQGYYFSKPILAEEISNVLESNDNSFIEQFDRYEKHKKLEKR